MRIISRATFGITILATIMSVAGTVEPVEATIVYPWCAHYGGRQGGGANSCGSTTYAQCMATASPNGYCSRNPFYEEFAPSAVKRPKRARG